ncbi:MAG: Fic family protein [Acidobacteriota bacterium]
MGKAPAKQPDIKVADRLELPSLMEPMLLAQQSPRRAEFTDLALTLAQTSAAFRASLPPAILGSLATLVRSMNCYYSNLIEDHNTHPVEIERALRGEYSKDVRKRDLQIEARAHIAVQEWIDNGGIAPLQATDPATILKLHRRFCEQLPADLLWVEDPESGERAPVVPGALRTRDVQVGMHIAISPGAVPRFLERFHEVYGALGKTEAILGCAAAHHRLLWIHPFLDGNGRVARLMSHTTLLHALNTGALWSIARGLARNVQQYKSLLADCDHPRRSDLDGRGSLSERSLIEFTRFFLETCIDQVRFMESLCEPTQLRARILTWAAEEIRLNRLPANADTLLDAMLYRGEIPRADVPALLGVGERHARRTVSALHTLRAVTSDSPRAPVRLAFPAILAARWFPGLFPAA